MKKFILIIASAAAFLMAAPTEAGAATAFDGCIVCNQSPAARYARKHKEKTFKGYQIKEKKRQRKPKRHII